jgi:hypothetical protein
VTYFYLILVAKKMRLNVNEGYSGMDFRVENNMKPESGAFLSLFFPQIAMMNNVSTSGLDFIQIDNDLLNSDEVDFLNDFIIATEKKALPLMTFLVKSQPLIALYAYKKFPSLIKWCEQNEYDTDAYEEIYKVLGALVSLYARYKKAA